MKERLSLLCVSFVLLCGCGRQNAGHPMAPDIDVLGAIDQPREGTQINQPFAVSGWAVTSDGIQWVAIYVDGEFLAYAKTGLSRPDVHNLYPDKRDSGSSGWQFDADPGLFINGEHRLTIDVCSKGGLIRSLGTVSVDVVHPKTS